MVTLAVGVAGGDWVVKRTLKKVQDRVLMSQAQKTVFQGKEQASLGFISKENTKCPEQT